MPTALPKAAPPRAAKKCRRRLSKAACRLVARRVDLLEDALVAVARLGRPFTIDDVDLITSVLLPEVYGEAPPPAEPSADAPGGEGRLAELARRFEAGESLFREGDESLPFASDLEVGLACAFFDRTGVLLERWRRQTSERRSPDPVAAPDRSGRAYRHRHEGMIRLDEGG